MSIDSDMGEGEAGVSPKVKVINKKMDSKITAQKTLPREIIDNLHFQKKKPLDVVDETRSDDARSEGNQPKFEEDNAK